MAEAVRRRRGRPRRLLAPPCPDPAHAGSTVASKGVRDTKAGTKRRYVCRPAGGEQHWFSVLVVEAGGLVAPWSPPPACGEHPGGHVVRDGTYGSRARPRQRYRCYPDRTDRDSFHRFTPPLPREHVVAGDDQCDECDEHRGVHHGEMSVARRHSWPARIVARALAELSAGGSYGDVSRWALRAVGRAPSGGAGNDDVELVEPAVEAHDEDSDGDEGVEREVRSEKPKSRGTAASNNAWHIAADWTEAFAPAIFGPLEDRLRRAALTERQQLDELRAQGKLASPPQVVLLDDVPVYGRAWGQDNARRDEGFFVLVAAEYH